MKNTILSFFILLLCGQWCFADVCTDAGFEAKGTTCFRMVVIPWIAMGNGWTTTVSFGNIKLDGSETGAINIGYALISNDNWGPSAYMVSNWHEDRTEFVANGSSFALPAGESVRAKLLYKAVCTYTASGSVSSCIPDNSVTFTGWLQVYYFG